MVTETRFAVALQCMYDDCGYTIIAKNDYVAFYVENYLGGLTFLFGDSYTNQTAEMLFSRLTEFVDAYYSTSSESLVDKLGDV